MKGVFKMKNTRKTSKIPAIGLALIVASTITLTLALATCSGGGGGATHTHQYGEWTVRTMPTCTTAGEITGICPNDGETTLQTLAPLGHTAPEIPATCTVAGNTGAGPCDRCGVPVTGSVIPALGHTPDTETGLCTVCSGLTYSLGDTGPGGGKIFYRLEAGFPQYMHFDDTVGTTRHYLEAAPDNMPTTLAWASSEYTATNISSINVYIGEGRLNTTVILAADADAPAAKACNDYSNAGKTDWFLPSYDELQELYTNRNSVGNMGTDEYWSSSQYGSTQAQAVRFINGWSINYTKSTDSNVRAVRAF
jgi:hypothetical protein